VHPVRSNAARLIVAVLGAALRARPVLAAAGVPGSAIPATAVIPPATTEPSGDAQVSAAEKPLPAIFSRSPEVAAYLSLSPLSSTNTMQLRLDYGRLPGGGYSAAAELRTGLWMPYALIPGVEVPHMGSLWVISLGYQVLELPGVPGTAHGLNDVTIVEQTVYGFSWGGVALGPIAELPSATSPALGLGKLQIGPLAAIGVSKVRGLLVTLSVGNLFSVAGAPDRARVDTLFIVPTVGLMLPRASYLFTDPVWRIDWTRDGRASMPLNLGVGHAFSAHFVAFIEPEWVATGDLKHSYALRVGLTDIGW
jgi:hypothetical protein